MTPPSTGATIGATLDSVMNRENSRAAATPAGQVGGHRAGQHDAAAAGAPCTNRHTVSSAADGASAQSTEATAQTSGRPEQQPAATPGVGQRAEDELADDQPDDVGGQRELDGGLAGAELVGEQRERRQVEVHRQRAERGEPAEQQRSARRSAAAGDAVGGRCWSCDRVSGGTVNLSNT